MSELSPLTGTIDHVHSNIVNTPHEAQVIDGTLPHQRHAIAVTEEHGLQVEDIEVDERAFPFPVRAVGERTVADLDSFLAELERFPLDDTAGTLWGNAEQGRLTAIYNDHTTGQPGWRDNKLTLRLAADADWAAWHTMSGHYFPQQQFGDKVEELLHTISDPDQAELLEIIDSVRASTSGEFESSIERANGGQKLTYKQEHTVRAGRTGQLELPQTITLRLRPWEGHPEMYDVEAYFRTQVRDGSLTLAIKLKPTRQIVRMAWVVVSEAVTDTIGKAVLAVC